jgi:hypothetical protein
MRYHWGLAVGHVYTHRHECTNEGVSWPGINEYECLDSPDEERGPPDQDQMMEEPNQTDHVDVDLGSGTDGSGSDSDDEDWSPSEEDESQSSDDEYLADIDDMYGEGGSDDGYEG